MMPQLSEQSWGILGTASGGSRRQHLIQLEGFSKEGASKLRLTGWAGVRLVKGLPGSRNSVNRTQRRDIQETGWH